MMDNQKYARCDSNNVVIEFWVTPDWKPDMLPSEVFTPALAAQFMPCPMFVGQNWIHDAVSDNWSPPVTFEETP